MKFLQLKKFIQGGMGVDVSNYRLAKIFAGQKVMNTTGIISDKSLDVVNNRAQQLGPRNISLRSDYNE